jgi:hypothetical protein
MNRCPICEVLFFSTGGALQHQRDVHPRPVPVPVIVPAQDFTDGAPLPEHTKESA